MSTWDSTGKYMPRGSEALHAAGYTNLPSESRLDEISQWMSGRPEQYQPFANAGERDAWVAQHEEKRGPSLAMRAVMEQFGGDMGAYNQWFNAKPPSLQKRLGSWPKALEQLKRERAGQEEEFVGPPTELLGPAGPMVERLGPEDLLPKTRVTDVTPSRGSVAGPVPPRVQQLKRPEGFGAVSAEGQPSVQQLKRPGEGVSSIPLDPSNPLFQQYAAGREEAEFMGRKPTWIEQGMLDVPQGGVPLGDVPPREPMAAAPQRELRPQFTSAYPPAWIQEGLAQPPLSMAEATGSSPGVLEAEDMAYRDNPVKSQARFDSMEMREFSQSMMTPKTLAAQNESYSMGDAPQWIREGVAQTYGGGDGSWPQMQAAHTQPIPGSAGERYPMDLSGFPATITGQGPAGGVSTGDAPYVAGQQFHPGMFPGTPAPQPGPGPGVDGLWPHGAPPLRTPEVDGTWPQIPLQSWTPPRYVAGEQYTLDMFPSGPEPLTHRFHKERGFFGNDDVFIGDRYRDNGASQTLNQREMLRKRRANEKFSKISRGY